MDGRPLVVVERQLSANSVLPSVSNGSPKLFALTSLMMLISGIRGTGQVAF